MTTAIIIAGGSGHRMGQDIPKQFINVYDCLYAGVPARKIRRLD